MEEPFVHEELEEERGDEADRVRVFGESFEQEGEQGVDLGGGIPRPSRTEEGLGEALGGFEIFEAVAQIGMDVDEGPFAEGVEVASAGEVDVFGPREGGCEGDEPTAAPDPPDIEFEESLWGEEGEEAVIILMGGGPEDNAFARERRVSSHTTKYTPTLRK